MAHVRVARYRYRRSQRLRSLSRTYPLFSRSQNSDRYRRDVYSVAKTFVLPNLAVSQRFVDKGSVPMYDLFDRTNRRIRSKVIVRKPAVSHKSAGFLFPSLFKAYVCARRKIRKEVLIATGVSSGGGFRRPRFNSNSDVRC